MSRSIGLRVGEGIDIAAWNQMVIAAADRAGEKRYICKQKTPGGAGEEMYSLALKTEEEIAAHRKEHFCNGICGKMALSDVLLLTHIFASNDSSSTASVDLQGALGNIAKRADEKYQGFLGTIRKVLACFFNLIMDEKVEFFQTDYDPATRTSTKLAVAYNRTTSNKVPTFYGKSNADLARWVSAHLVAAPAEEGEG